MSDTYTTVARFTLPIEANLAKIRLEAAGIPSVLIDESVVGTYVLYANAVGGIKLKVLSEFAEAALAALGEPSAEAILDEEAEAFDDANEVPGDTRTLKPAGLMKAFLGVALVIAGLIGGVTLLRDYLQYRQFTENAAETKAFPAMDVAMPERGTGRYWTEVSYMTERGEIRRQMSLSRSAIDTFKSGHAIKVRYLRDNPQEAVEASAIEFAWPSTACALLAAAGLFLLFYRGRKPARAPLAEE